VSAAFIIDCSITMAWCFADEATPKTTKILDRLGEETALVPPLWFLETTNVLAMAEKRKRITAAESDTFLALLQTFDFEIDEVGTDRMLTHILPLCRTHKLTSYDAVYLDLAVRRGLPLASLDEDLRREAKTLGVPLLGK
jgi:predicted nucleic acid-binding protein